MFMNLGFSLCSQEKYLTMPDGADLFLFFNGTMSVYVGLYFFVRVQGKYCHGLI